MKCIYIHCSALREFGGLTMLFKEEEEWEEEEEEEEEEEW
jgi:hypothetical protein